jgi:dynein heavy chain
MSKDDPLQSTEREKEEDDNFYLLGLNTTKTLKNYDCWEENETPQELVEKFTCDAGYHGKCPIYTNKKVYEWTPVQILAYDGENNKYTVRILANNMIK